MTDTIDNSITTTDDAILDRIWNEIGLAQGYIKKGALTEKHLSGKHDQSTHGRGGRGKAEIEADLSAAKKAVTARMKEAKASGDYSGISVLRKKVRTFEDELKGAPDAVTTAKRDAYDAVVDGDLSKVPALKERIETAAKAEVIEENRSLDIYPVRSRITEYEGPLQDEAEFRRVEDELRTFAASPGGVKLAKEMGYDSPDEMLNAVVEDVQYMLDRSDVYMAVPSDVLPDILRGGFKNQHETYTSGGLMDPGTREAAEYNMFGIPKGSIAEKYPKYGFIAVDGRIGMAGSYGDVTIKFKQAVKTRTTFTAEDSLDAGGEGVVIPAAYGKPRLAALTGAYIPKLVSPKNNRPTTANMLSRMDTYWEAQLHGAVTASDIDNITFQYEPKPDVAKMLADLGIPYTVR